MTSCDLHYCFVSKMQCCRWHPTIEKKSFERARFDHISSIEIIKKKQRRTNTKTASAIIENRKCDVLFTFKSRFLNLIHISRRNGRKRASNQTKKQTNTNKANKQLFHPPKCTWKVPSRSKFSAARVQSGFEWHYVLIYEFFSTQHLW